LTFATLSSTSKKSRVTNTKSDQYEPAVYSDKVVWADGRNGDYDIYMYDLSTSTETPMVITGSTQFSPTIYENRIVWEDDRNGNQDIYMYDLSTSIETQITTNESGQCHPAIYGDRIVWIDFRNGDIPDIYMATLVHRFQSMSKMNFLKTTEITENTEISSKGVFLPCFPCFPWL